MSTKWLCVHANACARRCDARWLSNYSPNLLRMEEAAPCFCHAKPTRCLRSHKLALLAAALRTRAVGVRWPAADQLIGAWARLFPRGRAGSAARSVGPPVPAVRTDWAARSAGAPLPPVRAGSAAGSAGPPPNSILTVLAMIRSCVQSTRGMNARRYLGTLHRPVLLIDGHASQIQLDRHEARRGARRHTRSPWQTHISRGEDT